MPYIKGMKAIDDKVAIMMYHYVRPIKDSQFSRLKGLELDEFQNHLDILESYSTLLTPREFMNLDFSLNARKKPFSLLTFDDGLVDHYKYVLPELNRRGLKALFFPSSLPLEEKRIANVHRIQFLLESFQDPSQLLHEIESILSLKNQESLLTGLNVPNETAFYDKPTEKKIKYILQRALPPEIREDLLNKLFRQYVSIDETDFLHNIYMSEENLLELKASGMEIGSHGRAHEWLQDMPGDEQLRDVQLGDGYLSKLVPENDVKTFSYPYGSYNETTLKILEGMGFSFGFTVNKSFFDLDHYSLLEIPRFDANDIYEVFPC